MFILLLLLAQAFAQDLPSCDSKVYCQGDLLDTVQMARLYNDSKTFVDKKMRNDENTTLENFQKLIEDTNNNPTKDDIQKFVDDNFEEDNELEDWVPPDFNEKPEFLSRIENDQFKQFAEELVKVWPKLARKVKQDVIDNPGHYSLLPVEHGFIVPGGRFREFYYWDSYWIVKGLLLCEMRDTVKGMLDNFLSIVERVGFLPNGARVYYLNRSQPPLLSLMVWTYIQVTNDTEWLQNNIQTLDKELQYWLDNKLVTVNKDGINYTLAHYNSQSGSPRPESYYEDVTTAASLDAAAQKQLWADLKSGAESGLDFSTRWIIDENGGNNANLSSLRTRRIIPVDLNAFLSQAFRKLAELYVKVDDYNKALSWFQKANLWRSAIDNVLYDPDDGIWYDWDSVLNQHRKYFYPSNFAPLWAEVYAPEDAEELGEKAAEYLVKNSVLDYLGGIPASLSNSGEQWDFPNAWPPLQSIVITGLHKTGNCQAKQLAKELATRWVAANNIGFNQTGEMFEKYDAVNPGQYGGGGEYQVQSGFGWTNGVIFEFLERFFLTEPSRKRRNLRKKFYF